MSRGFNNLPPGMGPFDSDQGDIYTCSMCHEGFDESEIDPEASAFFEHVCRECARVKRERERAEEADANEGDAGDTSLD